MSTRATACCCSSGADDQPECARFARPRFRSNSRYNGGQFQGDRGRAVAGGGGCDPEAGREACAMDQIIGLKKEDRRRAVKSLGQYLAASVDAARFNEAPF